MGKPSKKLVDNIKTDLRHTGWYPVAGSWVLAPFS
jgi:hypothetical protein